MKALVIDTNILVAALLSKNGKAYQLLNDVLSGKYHVVCSSDIYDEYCDVLHREEFHIDPTYVDYILHWFAVYAEFIEPQKSTDKMIDEDDRIFYDTAKARKALLVTRNVKHYPVDEVVTLISELYP